MARKCIVCGKEYNYCRSCPKDAKKETWYALYDNENCKDISQALTDYNFKRITKEEVKDILSKCDLSINLNEYYRNEINVVMAKPKRGMRAKVMVIDETITETEAVEVEKALEQVIEEIKEEATEDLGGVVITE